jgi:hypothetical protein
LFFDSMLVSLLSINLSKILLAEQRFEMGRYELLLPFFVFLSSFRLFHFELFPLLFLS